MGRPPMGTNCSGEDRRSCLQRARRGVRSGNVHEEGLRHHLARMPEPLLVLRRTQTRRRSAPGVTRARRMDRPRRQSACLLARTHRRGVRHACPATASATVRRRTGGRAYDPGDGRTATRVTPRFALFRIRYTQRPRTAQSRGKDAPRCRLNQGRQPATLLCADRLQRRYLRESPEADGRGMAGRIYAFRHALPRSRGKIRQNMRRFQGQWANPTITYCNCKKYFGK